MQTTLWVLTLIGSLIGGYEFFSGIANATSAPQQAAQSAMAVAWVVLPYCAARAWEGATRNAKPQKQE